MTGPSSRAVDYGAPFLVACTDEAEGSAPQLTRVDLVKAGYRVKSGPDGDQVLLVRYGS
ncbi:hypothetical protein [Nonomuraea sp. KM90]|uniref:hypothetical protein n=1 Tax=Nonomuraea sp. KM90 TaxID=3457428 RepID=UPI003FCCAD35